MLLLHPPTSPAIIIIISSVNFAPGRLSSVVARCRPHHHATTRLPPHKSTRPIHHSGQSHPAHHLDCPRRAIIMLGCEGAVVVLYHMPVRSGGVDSGLETIVPASLECDFSASPSHIKTSLLHRRTRATPASNTLILLVLHGQAIRRAWTSIRRAWTNTQTFANRPFPQAGGGGGLVSTVELSPTF